MVCFRVGIKFLRLGSGLFQGLFRVGVAVGPTPRRLCFLQRIEVYPYCMEEDFPLQHMLFWPRVLLSHY